MNTIRTHDIKHDKELQQKWQLFKAFIRYGFTQRLQVLYDLAREGCLLAFGNREPAILAPKKTWRDTRLVSGSDSVC